MRLVLFATLLALITACAESPSTEQDADGDAAAGDASDAMMPIDAAGDARIDSGTADAAPDAPACTCAGVSTCCDGCRPRSLGAQCDDSGLACKTSTSCQANGTCGGGANAQCAAPSEPQCQVAMCKEPVGCAMANNNEGWECNDGSALTHTDLCVSGACVGTPCECTTGPCCDGCRFRDTSFKCLDDGPIAAECTGTVVNYADLACGTVDIEYTIGDRWCTGTTNACTGATVASGGHTLGSCHGLEPDGMPANPQNPLLCGTNAASPLGASCRRAASFCP